MLQALLANSGLMAEQSGPARKVIRYLYLKLLNAVDIAKQMPLFEELNSAIVKVLGEADERAN